MRRPVDVDGTVPLQTPDALLPFVDAGVLGAADVHVAAALRRLVPGSSDDAVLAAALAVRAPRLGHVCVDLATVASATGSGDGTSPLPWPAADDWLRAVRAWRAVDAGDTGDTGNTGDDARPLHLDDSRLYLDRYWSDERLVARILRARAEAAPVIADPATLREPLARLFPGEGDAEQRAAAAAALLRPLAVIAGGPGTGKTTVVGRILAIIDSLEPLKPGRVALAAPTGKAAARLAEAVRETVAELPLCDAARARLDALGGSTLHRLLGSLPDTSSRFRHHRGNRLPHSLVVVDEASMVSLPLMARLLDALADDARLILVGDPQQLTSVEAGAVLGDVVGQARRRPAMRAAARAEMAAALGHEPDGDVTDAPIGDSIALLRRVHRFTGGIAELAEAIRVGEADTALRVLAAAGDDVRWIDADPATGDTTQVRDPATKAGIRLIEAARAGGDRDALDALGAFRLLVAHRRGPHGVETWNRTVERWLTGAGARPGTWYPGRPVLVTANDPALRLHNGDTGVIVARTDAPPAAAFAIADRIVHLSPGRIEAIAPVNAMTIHKSQGSQFDTVAVLLPPAESPLLTRELLYTAVTRARRRLIVIGEAASVRAAIGRPVARASGLESALWGPRRP